PAPARLKARAPRDLETICLKCLHKLPSRRYSTAQELAEDLHRFLDGKPVRARPVGTVERAVKWARRRPATATALAMLITLIALAIGGGRWTERQRAERHAHTAREEERETQAANAALEKAAILQQQGRWQEAQGVLESTLRLLADSNTSDLVDRVNRARTDAEMVATLEEIRL